MQQAAEELIDALEPEDARRLSHPFTDDARVEWTSFPREMAGGHFIGVPLFELDLARRKAVNRLVETGVSLGGFAQLAAIQSLEMPLDFSESHRIAQWRDRSRYWVTVFGAPSDTGMWGWRFEGHHVALNFTISDGEVTSSTPIFFGANPSRVRNGPYDIVRPCGPEEDAGRELLAALDADRRAVAVLSEIAPHDNMTHWLPEVPEWAEPGEPPNPLDILQDVLVETPQHAKDALRFERATPRGLRRGDLGSSEQRMFDELLEVYLRRLPDPLAAAERERIDAAGRDDVHFAWAGSDRVDDAHYYRLQGPTVLIEYDNAQNDANHAHAVLRDPTRDFGYDLLRAHRANEH
jgi:hypothetical protein